MNVAEKVLQLKQDFDDVYEAGKNEATRYLWGSINNNRKQWNYAFGYWYAEDEESAKKIFSPNADIVPASSFNMFYCCMLPFDLQARLDELGVILDFSNSTSLNLCFYTSHLTRVGIIDVTKCTTSGVARLFENSKIKTIDELIFNEATAYNYDRMFKGATELENIEISGKITQSGLDVSGCTKLTHDSLMSFITALKEYTDGSTHTITFGATNLAKLSDAEKAIATQKGWTLL